MANVSEFKVWKRVKLGTGPRTPEDFRKHLMACGCSVGDAAMDLLGKISVATEETEVDLATISTIDLGFQYAPLYSEIYGMARSRGFDLCSAEVGPQLRVQYVDQGPREYLIIGMLPIVDSERNMRVFEVELAPCRRPWLFAVPAAPERRFGPDFKFVFVVRP